MYFPYWFDTYCTTANISGILEKLCHKTFGSSVNILYVNSSAKLVSSGPKPRKALVYFSSGTSLFLSSFIPKHSVYYLPQWQRSHQSHDITCRCCKCHLEYSNMLDYAVQIPDTVNRMEHPLAVLFMPLKLMPLKHSLSCLRGFTTSCHPWCKSVTSNKNEREARRGVRASNCELELPPKGSVLSWQNSRWRHLLFSLPPFTPNPYIYIGQTAAKVAAQPNQDARLPIGELWWCITHPFDGHT